MNVLKMHGKTVMRELIHVTNHKNFVCSYGSYYKNVYSFNITLTKDRDYMIRIIIVLNNFIKM